MIDYQLVFNILLTVKLLYSLCDKILLTTINSEIIYYIFLYMF